MRFVFVLVFLSLFAVPAHATCNKFITATATPAAVDVDTEQTSQYSQDYNIHIVNNDDAGCASRQFCFYPSLVMNQPGSISLANSHLLITPNGNWICVGLLPTDSANFTLTVAQDQNGEITPPHYYYIYALFRSGPNNTYPLIGSGLVAYNRHDPWGNTCAY